MILTVAALVMTMVGLALVFYFQYEEGITTNYFVNDSTGTTALFAHPAKFASLGKCVIDTKQMSTKTNDMFSCVYPNAPYCKFVNITSSCGRKRRLGDFERVENDAITNLVSNNITSEIKSIKRKLESTDDLPTTDDIMVSSVSLRPTAAPVTFSECMCVTKVTDGVNPITITSIYYTPDVLSTMGSALGFVGLMEAFGIFVAVIIFYICGIIKCQHGLQDLIELAESEAKKVSENEDKDIETEAGARSDGNNKSDKQMSSYFSKFSATALFSCPPKSVSLARGDDNHLNDTRV